MEHWGRLCGGREDEEREERQDYTEGEFHATLFLLKAVAAGRNRSRDRVWNGKGEIQGFLHCAG